ncbi:uroporphyrinogen-III synthase [Flagellimonas pacifica]|uniref:Uroporphyrinogen-III synthase n=1 Tax=Flagellimonas pacifica TaxID=1247520 RepID=A0A285MEK0_9FLAO|nr:uroporphyrinogen-III synthase [Allomuricauda parva]SNY95153.1 uroporphyrinogen-III synthase [Allomuricauda parva]
MNKKIQIARLLRKEQTKAEKKLWRYLRNRNFENLKFRRQHPLKEYIVDFFCEEYGIVIELDGEYHNEINQAKKDELRDLHLTELGYIVIRFENKVVFEQVDVLFQAIENAKKKQHEFSIARKQQLKKRSNIRKNHLSPTLSSSRGSKTVLSTKILTPSQKELLLNSGIGFVEYNALEFEFLDIAIPPDYSNLIFTSKNAVKAFLRQSDDSNVLNFHAYCVGEKTKSFLEEKGLKVVKMAQNASELGHFIVKNHRNERFIFLSGNQRRLELPELLEKNNIRYKEVQVYNTHLRPKKFNRVFDGVLFFSPSGIRSCLQENEIGNSWAFCIGATTSLEAKKHTSQIIIANKPTVENVLVQVIKHFKQHD